MADQLISTVVHGWLPETHRPPLNFANSDRAAVVVHTHGHGVFQSDEATGAKKAAGGAIAEDDEANRAGRAGTGSSKDGLRGGGNLSAVAVAGMIVASSAITGIVAGTASPPVAFGLYLILLSPSLWRVFVAGDQSRLQAPVPSRLAPI